ncbi:MAG: hypothetical protein KA260_03635 [Burkholderiales bacterium]|nr:hypothetical protein [Burkholderiales bacterium]
MSLKSACTRTASTRSPNAFFRRLVANGVRGHVGLTADALAFKYFCAKCEKEYKAKSDHNGIKGYFSA